MPNALNIIVSLPLARKTSGFEKRANTCKHKFTGTLASILYDHTFIPTKCIQGGVSHGIIMHTDNCIKTENILLQMTIFSDLYMVDEGR